MEVEVDGSKCIVCDKVVGGAHKCDKCKNHVHLICGKGIGENGYGQTVVCFKYLKPKTNSNGKLFCNVFNIFLLISARRQDRIFKIAVG